MLASTDAAHQNQPLLLLEPKTAQSWQRPDQENGDKCFMKVAIMQPYFLPYLGYFQLMAKVDCFVVYDDVDFIKGGWINRNNILLNGASHLMTIPLAHATRGALIKDVQIAWNSGSWRRKLDRKLETAYGKAPMFDEWYPWLTDKLNEEEGSISRLNVALMKKINDYCRLDVRLVETSSHYGNNHLSRAGRLADICLREGSSDYVNAAGGRQLYDQAMFDPYGVDLKFLKPEIRPYQQGGAEFVPNLSILDVLMWCSRDEVADMVRGGSLED